MKNDAAIIAHRLSYRYGVSKKIKDEPEKMSVIYNLDLALPKGEAVALTGPNGAGKTTLGKLLAGILKPTAGQVLLFGENTGSLPLYKIGEKVGYGFQNPERQLFASNVEEEIGFGLKYRGAPAKEVKDITDELIALFQLDAVRNSFPLNLSFGEKKRVALAAALALSPEYLILDEPTIGLDSRRVGILTEVLKKYRNCNKGMLIISHNEEFLHRNTERILIMERGRIVHDNKY